MRFLLLCREPRLYSCQRLKQACEAKSITLDILDPNRCFLRLNPQSQPAFELYYQQGEAHDKTRALPVLLPAYDGVLPRFGSSSTVMGCKVVQHLTAQGSISLNEGHAIHLARDKWDSLQRLAATGIAIPQTWLSGELADVGYPLSHLSTPVVVKTLQGSQGDGVMLLNDHVCAKSVLHTFQHAHIPFLQQTFVAESKGRDIRAFVIGDRVVAAMQRQGVSGDFRANIHKGGTATPLILNEAQAQLAVRATQTLGLDVAGVDFVYAGTGLQVLEVNASPGLEMIEKVSRVNIAEQMIDALLSKIIASH